MEEIQHLEDRIKFLGSTLETLCEHLTEINGWEGVPDKVVESLKYWVPEEYLPTILSVHEVTMTCEVKVSYTDILAASEWDAQAMIHERSPSPREIENHVFSIARDGLPIGMEYVNVSVSVTGYEVKPVY